MPRLLSVRPSVRWQLRQLCGTMALRHGTYHLMP